MATTATISSSLGVHPLRFMALKNICSEGYTHTCRRVGGQAEQAGAEAWSWQHHDDIVSMRTA
jgi:hypothetical protein